MCVLLERFTSWLYSCYVTILPVTIHNRIRDIYLANIKFGGLDPNANWQTINLVNRVILSVHCFMTFDDTRDHKQCWHTFNLAIKAKIAK